jgi:hypothetical protein
MVNRLFGCSHRRTSRLPNRRYSELSAKLRWECWSTGENKFDLHQVGKPRLPFRPLVSLPHFLRSLEGRRVQVGLGRDRDLLDGLREIIWTPHHCFDSMAGSTMSCPTHVLNPNRRLGPSGVESGVSCYIEACSSTFVATPYSKVRCRTPRIGECASLEI